MKQLNSPFKFFAFSFLLIFYGLLNGQYTSIPDANFEQALIDLGIDSDGIINGQIATSDAVGVTNLNVSSKSISDLSGIEDFIDLISLYCGGNQLDSLFLKDNTILETLVCVNSQLVSLDVSMNTNLKFLYCSFNQLSTLDISNNLLLEELECGNNNLSILNTSNNPNLTILQCDQNSISSLNLSANNNLRVLFCHNNNITTLDVSSNNNLRQLNCASNQLTSLDVSSNGSLFQLHCSSNILKSLDIRNGNNLSISNSNYRSLNNPELYCIYVDDPAYSLANWTNVDVQSTFTDDDTDIDMDGVCDAGDNCPSTFNPFQEDVNNDGIGDSCEIQVTLIPDPNFEQALIDLGIDSDGIINGQILTADALGVTSLFLSNRNISDLSGIEAFVDLLSINCSSNPLDSLFLESNTQLNTLRCLNAQLVKLDISMNTNLEILNCSFNQLSTLDISNNLLLEELECGNNNLSILNTSNNPSLNIIQCDQNSISSLNLSANNNLRVLFCHNNNITTLDVSSNNNLRQLNCASNQLTSLDVSSNGSLFQLHCSSNILKSLDIRNGNNLSINNSNYRSLNNPELYCIYVDDPAYSLANWTNVDVQSTFTDDDTDIDMDGVCDAGDNCPSTFNPFQEDVNNDGIGDSCEIQVTLIPDPNFEQALIDLGIDSDGIINGQMITSDAAGETNLFLSNKNIADLTGIEAFIDLQNLTIQNNQISSLDLTNNTKLTNLNCSFNQLTTLDLSQNLMLHTLSCQNNQIINLNLNANNLIQNLYCYSNQLTSLNIDGCSLLKTVDSRHNQLDSLDVSTNINLQTLTCYDNNLSTINFGSISNLRVLHCQQNQLTSLDLGTNVNLLNLLCGNNQIGFLDLSSNILLELLSCIDNGLTSLDVSHNINLERLLCWDNQIISLDLINNGNLKEIRCMRNQLLNLDVQNGNNSNIQTFNSTGNPDLSCIYVNDLAHANANWTKDATATFVNNNSLPEAICMDTLIILNEFGFATLNLNQIDAGSSNVCGIVSLELSDTLFDCSDVGINSVILLVSDENGNTDSCVAKVEVIDNTPPEAICLDTFIFLDQMGVAFLSPDQINAGSYDNCIIASQELSDSIFDCSDVGMNQVTMFVTDIYGNTDSCQANVVVIDNTPPLAICIDTFIILNELGYATLNSNQIDVGSSDACGIVFYELSDTLFDCSQVGSNTVMLTAQDLNGNTNSCFANVQVIDNTLPEIFCIDTVIVLDEMGFGFLSVDQIDGGSSDACGIAWRVLSDTIFDCSDVGMNEISLYLSDVNGNMDSCQVNVEVIDNTPPQIICIDTFIILNELGYATLNINQINAGSSDACGIVSLELSDTLFDCSQVGSNIVKLTAQDINGNTNSCFANVQVIDNALPEIFCIDTVIVLDEMGLGFLSVDQIDGGSSDACGTAWRRLSDSLFDCSNVGMNNVTIFVSDVNGNTDSCFANVQVIDNTPPEIFCIDTIIVLDEMGFGFLSVDQIDGGSSDACGIAWRGLSDTLFDCSDVGMNEVTLFVNDVNGNTDSCQVNVQVIDNTPPETICMDELIVIDFDHLLFEDNQRHFYSAIKEDGFKLDQDVPEIFQPRDEILVIHGNQSGFWWKGSPAVWLTLASNPPTYASLSKDNGGEFDVISVAVATQINSSIPQQITFEGITSNGNIVTETIISNSATQLVNYILDPNRFRNLKTFRWSSSSDGSFQVDDIAVKIRHKIVIQLDANGQAVLDPANLSFESLDACGIESLQLNNTLFDCSDVGMNEVTLFVNDVNGNTDSCQVNVQVIDNTPPQVICMDTFIILNEYGYATLNINQINAGSSDACGIVSLELSDTLFDCSDVGMNDVTLFVSDVNGNTDSCQVNVQVIDNTPPEIFCIDTIIVLDEMGLGFLSVDQIDGGSSDACGIAWRRLSDTIFDCSDVGMNEISLYLSDVNGNMDSCQVNVEVIDNTPPQIICIDTFIILNEYGYATLNINQINAGSSDACGIVSLELSDTLFDCSQVGSNIVKLTAQDINGNTDSCFANVQVIDNTPPEIFCMDTIIVLDEMGLGFLSVDQIDGGSSDACGIAWRGLSDTLFDCSDVGMNEVTLFVNDVNGNTDSCQVNVEVIDNTPPQVICMDTFIILNEYGYATLNINQINAGSSDACGIVSLELSDTLFDCSQVGSNMVKLTAQDINGNTNSCFANVQVIDNAPPEIFCIDTVIVLDEMGFGFLSVDQIDGGSSDACGIAWRGLSDTLFDCSDVGMNEVTLFVSDVNGNTDSCQVNVEVIDNTPPEAICLDTFIFLDQMGIAFLSPDHINDGSYDNCIIVAQELSDSIFDCSNVGMNQVTLFVTDIYGNTDSCQVNVEVIDNIPPAISFCPADTSIILSPGECEVVYTYSLPTAADNCAIDSIVLIQGLGSGATFSFGSNVELFEITDINGNKSICSFTIMILGDQKDKDGDGVPNACDQCPGFDDLLDSDGDGIVDCLDPCPLNSSIVDGDNDGIPDACDNCPDVYNDKQKDKDGDGIGDKCDVCPKDDDSIDTDGDGTPDCLDLCPGEDDSLDSDNDGIPDACDNCPDFFNDKQKDKDGDGIGDKCDVCPKDDDSIDTDGDGTPDCLDLCSGEDDSQDDDNDGIPNACDNCPDVFNDKQKDKDGDGIGDECELEAAKSQSTNIIGKREIDKMLNNVEIFPNPFLNELTLEINVSKPSKAKVFVFNTQGQLIKTLFSEQMSRGTHYLKWQETNEILPKGIYLIQIQLNEKAINRKVVKM